jgi:ABC-type molybdenum transport system ATPase subunit/photorepair protein PhrA
VITITRINIQVKKGELLSIVGQVGSGKTSLLSALIGDMYKLSGEINVYGNSAYAPQQAWFDIKIVIVLSTSKTFIFKIGFKL